MERGGGGSGSRCRCEARTDKASSGSSTKGSKRRTVKSKRREGKASIAKTKRARRIESANRGS